MGPISATIMLITVVFPAPLGPNNPNTSPSSTANEAFLTAVFISSFWPFLQHLRWLLFFWNSFLRFSAIATGFYKFKQNFTCKLLDILKLSADVRVSQCFIRCFYSLSFFSIAIVIVQEQINFLYFSHVLCILHASYPILFMSTFRMTSL